MTTALEGVRGRRHAPAALNRRERTGTQCTGGWVGPSGPVWTSAENLAPTGIRSPDRPARSQSLYRLNYPALIKRTLLYLKRLLQTLFHLTNIEGNVVKMQARKFSRFFM